MLEHLTANHLKSIMAYFGDHIIVCHLSLYLTGAFDGDIIRRTCNWITDHKDLFGDTILEIGCDIGLIPCFLAKTFPNSIVTAIDRCKNGLAIGQKLADKFGLDQAKQRFLQADH